MKNPLFKNASWLLFIFFALFNIKYANAQRTYASSEKHGATGLLCLNCTVTAPASAADGNLQTHSIINVAVGVAASTHEDLIFAGAKPAAGIPVTVKLGSGDKLLSLTALGGVTLQAYNGTTAIGQPVAANTLLTALSNNNQLEVSITPQQTYDRLRITLNGGLVGVLANLYVYEAFYTGNAAAVCNTAIDELHGIQTGLLNLGANVGGVTNPLNAIDGNINTASTLSAAVGLVGAYATQTVIYSNTSVIGDSVRLTLSVPDALIQADVLSNIYVATYNGNNDNADLVNLKSALLTVRLLDLNSGNRKIVVTFVPTKVFDRVQLRLGGVANVLSSLNLYEAERVIPSPIIKIGNVVSTTAQICTGETATLTATSVPNTVFNWYTAATGGTPVHSGASFTTPALTTSAIYYVAAMRNGCTDESARTKVIVIVNAIPAAPVIANSTVSVCSGQSATFTANSVAGVTITWYSAATGGSLVHTGNSFTTSALTQGNSYYAEAVAGGTCPSPTRTKVTVNITPPPVAPTLATPNVTICDGAVASLSVSTPQAGFTYNWYSTSTGGTPVFTGPAYTTAALHADANYYVEAVNAGGCTSDTRTHATVTVVAIPPNPVLAANSKTINAGQKTSIAVTNTQTGVTYNWYTSAAAATPIFTGATFQTPLLYTSTTYYVSAVNATGCTSAARTAITINVNIDNNSPCTFANTQTTTVNGLCIGCGIDNPALATDADTTTASTINILAGLVGGYAQQILRFQQPGFAGDTIKLVLSNPGGLLSAAVLAQIQVRVYNGATLVSTTALNSSLIKISLLAGTSNKYAVYIPATAAYDRVSVRVNSGVASVLSSLNIYYAVQQYPKPVFNPASPEICKGSTAVINITSPANGTFNWYTTPTGGASVHTGASYTTPALNVNTTYYVEESRGTCVGTTRYPIQVLVDDAPDAPTIAAQNVTITSGQKATLNATASNGATIQWFADATGGTPIFTGNPFVTPALTADKTYYAGTALGSCVSATRTPVKITVNPIVIPNVAVTPPTTTVNPGQTAVFTATSTTPGAVFNWFTTPTGGTSIYTGATYTTPPQFATTTTYYAEASIPSTGAKSATRATGKVTVNQQAVNPTPCDAAIDQTNATSGLLCVGCGVANANGSIDGDRNTFAQLNVPVGVVGTYAQQTLRFANTGLAGDSVIIELGVPGTLASVGVLSSIAVSTYNGAAANNDSFNVNGSLISINLLSGTSRFRVAFKAAHDFDRVQIRLNAALAGVFSSLNIYDAAQAVPAPVISATPVTTCAGTQATLTATAPANVTIKWYTAATGGSPVFTGATFTTPALSATKTYYAEASRTADGCTQAVRTPATITVVTAPTAPVVAAPNTTVCSGQPATFSVTPATGVTYTWYAAATGGASLHTGNTFTTSNLTETTSYYVEAASGGQCSSNTRTKVTANVTATPADAVVTPGSQSTCSGSSATLTATSTQPGVTFNWYTTATGGTPVFTGAQYTTPALTADASYYVETATGTCVSADRTKATVTVNPTPVTLTVAVNPTGGQITSGQTATLTATSTTANVIFKWYSSATDGTAIHTGPTFTTPALTTNTTYYVEAVAASGCASTTRTPVTITVNPIFSTSCDFASSQTNSNSGVLCVGCGVTNPDFAVDMDTTNFSRLVLPLGLGGFQAEKLKFSDAGLAGDTVTLKIAIPASLATVGVLSQLQIASYMDNTYNADRISLNSSLIKIQILSGGQTALVKFVPGKAYNAVELRINGTVSLFDSADIYYATKQVPIAQLINKIVNACSGGSAKFTVSNPVAGVTYKWYSQAVGGNLLHTGITYTIDNLTANTTVYVESSRTSNSCPNPNRVAATANVTASPVNPILAQNAVAICAGDNVTLSVTNAGASVVTWYDAATGGTLLFTGANFQVSPIATMKYYAELSNGTCTSPARTEATVTVNPRPAAPGVESADVQVCTGSPATLKVLNPAAGVTYQWFAQQTSGNIVHTGDTYTTPDITANRTFYVQAVDATTLCANNGGRTAVNITVTDQVAAPTLSATSTNVCSGGSVTLSVTNPVNGFQYNWYTTVNGTTPVFTGTTFTVDNLTADVSYFVEATNSTGCVSTTRTRTDVHVQAIPTAPTVQADAGGLSVCEGSSASLSIVDPQTGFVYRWYDSATNGTLLYTGTQFNTPPISATTHYFVEASQAGNCNASARTEVTITINPIPADPTLVDQTVTVCAGSTATFKIASPQAGITYQWFDSPSQTNKLFEGTTYTTGPITTNTTYYVAAVNATGCQSASLTTANATIQAPPSAPVIANGTTVQTCINTTVTLSISNPQAGFTYNWYTTANSATPTFTGTSFTTPTLSGDKTYYVDAMNGTGCTSAARTQVDIHVNALPTAPVITAQGGSDVTSACKGNSITLVATSITADVHFNWYTTANGTTPVFTGATYTTPPINAATTYYVEAVSNAGDCSSTTRTAVQVTINNNTAPTPGVDAADLSICQNTAATIHISSPVAGTTYNWFTVATGGNSVYTGTAYTTPVLSANTTFYVEATNAQSCNPSARLAVNVVIVPQPTTPVPTDATVTACKGSPVTLSVQSPQLGITYNWYSNATRTNLLFTGPTYATDPINTNTTFYVDASNGSCSSSSVATVQVTVTNPPSAPLLVNGNQTACTGAQVTLTISNPQAGFTYNWYTAANGGSSVFTGNAFTTPVLTAGTTTYYAEAVNSNGCASTSRTSAAITVAPSPDAPQVNVPGAGICPGSTATLTATATAGATINWYSAATGGASLHTGASFTTPALNATTTYYAEASNAGGCTSATRTAGIVKVNQQLDAPVVTVTETTPNTITFSWSAVTGATGYEISLNNGTSFTPVNAAVTYQVTGLQPAQSETIIVRALGASDCQTSVNSAAVTGTTTNPLGDQIFVPNAFSPNGDGNNDVFLVYSTNIQSMTMSVYDQWGGQLFNSKSQASGWDGTYKGKAQPVGTYVYFIQAVMNDGQVIRKKGTINLLR